MAKNNSVLVTFVNRQGKIVKELCHNPNTCREHAPYIHGVGKAKGDFNVIEVPEDGLSAIEAIFRNVDEEQAFNTKSDLAYASKDTQILTELSFDADPVIRAQVASNSNTSKHILRRLYNEKTPEAEYIWKAVVGNPNAPYAVLSNAALSRDENILKILVSNRRAAGWMIQVAAKKVGDPVTLELIAQHPHTPAGTLDDLSNNLDSNVRSYAATNKNMKLETLQRLADDVPVVRAGVAYNGNITDEMALSFATDTAIVRRGLSRNPYRSKFSDEVQTAIALLGDL